MKIHTRTLMHPLHFFSLFLLSLGSCQCPTKNHTELTAGMRPLQFDVENTKEILITKEDPADRWSSRLESETGAPAALQWKIKSGPQGKELLDPWADTSFVRHFLSTLQTLSIVGSEVKIAPDASGLSHPRFQARWTSKEMEFEIRVGATLPDQSGSYVSFPRLADPDQTWVATGAALTMLDYLKSFEHLRLRRLATWEKEQVRSIELMTGLKNTFSATWVNGLWKDSEGKTFSPGVDEWLEKLLHLQIVEFVDDENESKRLFDRVSHLPAYQVRLKDAEGHALSLAIALERGSWWGISAERSKAAFRLYPESPASFAPPRVKAQRKRKLKSH